MNKTEAGERLVDLACMVLRYRRAERALTLLNAALAIGHRSERAETLRCEAMYLLGEHEQALQVADRLQSASRRLSWFGQLKRLQIDILQALGRRDQARAMIDASPLETGTISAAGRD